MVYIEIPSTRPFNLNEYLSLLGIKNCFEEPFDNKYAWKWYVKGQSVTAFFLQRVENYYGICIDGLASYDDYKVFPYMVDTLSVYLTDRSYEEDGKNAFQCFDEEWIEYTIGEEIALLKCTLAAEHPYFIDLPLFADNSYIEEGQLMLLGVTLHSSTPRIYGYVQYMLKKDLVYHDKSLPVESNFEDEEEEEEEEYDVPQHESIGIVKSWQTDGAETTESYSKEDIQCLLGIADAYRNGVRFEGVVLNDIGTIHEHGIGIETNMEEAIFWYKEAIKNGDMLYAPTNLGDIYRKGKQDGTPDYQKAMAAYLLSEDPYAWYRIGQSYEEGWNSTPDLDLAMEWYRKAAAAGHHLALKRLGNKD